MNVRFHLAMPIKDLEKTRQFYVEFLGCKAGRSAHNWIDFDFFGHQITAQVMPDAKFSFRMNKEGVPVRHFGAILPWDEWHRLREKWEKEGVEFMVKPRTVFPGEVGEQVSMFLLDPNGYAIEFKSFENPDSVFAS